MGLPYFPLYPTDFEADTSHLTLEEDGAYNRLLRLMWMTPGCSLPDDDKWIMRRMRVDHATYERVIAPILEEFFERKSGRVHSPRLTKEFKKADETSKKRSDAGKKGGRPKAVENKQKEEKAGISREKAGTKHPEPEPDIDDDDTREATHRERLLSEMGVDPSGVTGPSGRMIGTRSDMSHVEKWSSAGVSEKDQIAIVRDVMARKRDGPPASFRYFDQAMADFAANKDRPLPSARKPSQQSSDDADIERFNKLAGA